MKPPVRGIKKSTVQPVIITTDTNKFTPKISERTIRKRKEARERRLKPGICTNTLSTCGLACLYIFLILCIIIGAGGIALCIVYFNADASTQTWKIIGIVLGVITCIIGIILILMSIFKQTRNRSWRAKNEEKLVNEENYYSDDGDDLNIEDLNGNKPQSETRETASSPIPNAFYTSENALQNDFFRHPEQVSMAIQTEDAEIEKNRTHTTIDQSKKYSNITDSITYRRVPIPTTKVVVQQPTTKVMIVRVPNTAGELIIQSREPATNGK